MGGIAKSSLKELTSITNESESTKEGIIKIVELDPKCKNALEMKEEIKEEEVKDESFEFRPEDVQTLVNRKEFKDRYVVRDKDRIIKERTEDKIIQFRTKEKEEKEIEK